MPAASCSLDISCMPVGHKTFFLLPVEQFKLQAKTIVVKFDNFLKFFPVTTFLVTQCHFSDD